MATQSQIINDGARNTVIRLTNIFEAATEETNVQKVDVSSLSDSPSLVRIDKISYATSGVAVRILWDATANDEAFLVPADESHCVDFSKSGGIPNPKSSGYTGDILFTTVGATSGDTYDITLHLKKKTD